MGNDGMRTWLCLSGGNALGAFHAGAWKAIQDAALNVTRISGASIGAIVAAVIAGNPPDRRVESLDRFLNDIAQSALSGSGRRRLVTGTLLFGNPALFSPSVPGLAEILPGVPPDRAVFHRRATRRLIEEYVDFDLLNAGGIEVTVTATDAETGTVAAFRNTVEPLTVDHLMASSALPVLFPPVTLNGRHFMDAGLAENLPLRPLLDRDDDALILACDLYSAAGPLRQTMDGIADRAQELAFGCQSRRAIAACDLTGRRFHHVILSDPEDDFSGKSFDYSQASLRRRSKLGHMLMAQALESIIAEPPT